MILSCLDTKLRRLEAHMQGTDEAQSQGLASLLAHAQRSPAAAGHLDAELATVTAPRGLAGLLGEMRHGATEEPTS